MKPPSLTTLVEFPRRIGKRSRREQLDEGDADRLRGCALFFSSNPFSRATHGRGYGVSSTYDTLSAPRGPVVGKCTMDVIKLDLAAAEVRGLGPPTWRNATTLIAWCGG